MLAGYIKAMRHTRPRTYRSVRRGVGSEVLRQEPTSRSIGTPERGQLDAVMLHARIDFRDPSASISTNDEADGRTTRYAVRILCAVVRADRRDRCRNRHA